MKRRYIDKNFRESSQDLFDARMEIQETERKAIQKVADEWSK